jgi:hypothetical protein
MRLQGQIPAVPWAYLPMRVQIEPVAPFATWIRERLEMARRQRGMPSAEAVVEK